MVVNHIWTYVLGLGSVASQASDPNPEAIEARTWEGTPPFLFCCIFLFIFHWTSSQLTTYIVISAHSDASKETEILPLLTCQQYYLDD